MVIVARLTPVAGRHGRVALGTLVLSQGKEVARKPARIVANISRFSLRGLINRMTRRAICELRQHQMWPVHKLGEAARLISAVRGTPVDSRPAVR
jgi:hypothetical protein